MKKITFILAMLPLVSFAQKANQASDKKIKSFVVHHEQDLIIYCDNVIVDNKRSKSQITVPGPGDWNFGRDTGITLAQKAKNAEKKPDWDKGYMTANKVTITCPAYPDIKADKFTYDQNTDKAMLSGHVTLVDHGTGKYIGEVAYLDFSDDTYKITGLK